MRANYHLKAMLAVNSWAGQLTPSLFGIAYSIAMHANASTGKCYPSIDRLAAHLNCSRRTIMRAIKELETIGVLTVKRSETRGKSHTNQYVINLSTGKQANSDTSDTIKSQIVTPVTANSDKCDTQIVTPVSPEQVKNNLLTGIRLSERDKNSGLQAIGDIRRRLLKVN